MSDFDHDSYIAGLGRYCVALCCCIACFGMPLNASTLTGRGGESGATAIASGPIVTDALFSQMEREDHLLAREVTGDRTTVESGTLNTNSASAVITVKAQEIAALLERAGAHVDPEAVTVQRDSVRIVMSSHDGQIATVARALGQQLAVPWTIMLESHLPVGPSTGTGDFNGAMRRTNGPVSSQTAVCDALNRSRPGSRGPEVSGSTGGLRNCDRKIGAGPQLPRYVASALQVAAESIHLPLSMLSGVVWAESHGQHLASSGAVVTSPAGARGLMQLMPSTAHAMGANPDDFLQNVAAGTAYLAALTARYHGDAGKALAAYNCGPACVDAAISKGRDNWRDFLPVETASYVRLVLATAASIAGSSDIPGSAPRGNAAATQIGM